MPRQIQTGPNQVWDVDPETGALTKAQLTVPRYDAFGNEVGTTDVWGLSPSKDSFMDKGMDALVKGAAFGGMGLGAMGYLGAGGAIGAGAGAGAGGAAAGDAAVGGGEGMVAGSSAAEGAGMGGGDWWSQYGLTAADVGETAAPDWWSQYGLTAGDVSAGSPGATMGTAGAGVDYAGLLKQYGPMAARLAPALLGAYASNKQTGALQNLAGQYANYGAPSRARYEVSMAPGFDPMSIPGYSGAVDTASKGVLARLSANGGNPFGNPGGLIDAQKQVIAGTALPAIQGYQNLNAGTGFGSTLGASGGMSQNAIGAQGNVYNAIGAGINDVVNPPQTLADQLKAMKDAGLYSKYSL